MISYSPPPPPPLTPARAALIQQQAEYAADRLWGGEFRRQCAAVGGVTYEYKPLTALQGEFSRLATDPNERTRKVAGYASGCKIIAPSDGQFTLSYRCNLLVHELGHVSRQKHSEDRNNIMHPLGGRVPECGFAFYK